MASKAAQQEPVSAEAIEEMLDTLDKTLDRVKVLYEQYFLGIQKQPPTFIHTDVERKIRDLAQIQIRNTALRYRYATIQQKFGSYNTYWRRTLRQIENGTYARNLQKIGRRAAQTGEEIPEEILAAMPKRMREQIRRDREAALALARRRGDAPVDDGSVDVDLAFGDSGPTDKQPALDPARAAPPGRRDARGAHVLDDDDDFDVDAFFASVTNEGNDDEPTETGPPPTASRTPVPPQQTPTNVRIQYDETAPQQRITGPVAAQPTPAPVSRVTGPVATQKTQPQAQRPTPVRATTAESAPTQVMDAQVAPTQQMPAQRQTGPVPAQRRTGPIPVQQPVEGAQPPTRGTVVPPAQRQGPLGAPSGHAPAQPGRGTGAVPQPVQSTAPPAQQQPAAAPPFTPVPPQRTMRGIIPTPPAGTPTQRPTPAPIPGIPSIPAPPRAGAAPSQAVRPNPIAPGSSADRQTPVESMSGPFQRGEPPRPTVPRPAPPVSARAVPTAPKPAVPAPQGAPAQRPPPGMTDADVNALYAKYVKAKEMVGEQAGPGAYGKLLKTINSQAPKIMEQYKSKGVDFTVVVKDNQVIIRTKPKP